jgi:hypothetical protein
MLILMSRVVAAIVSPPWSATHCAHTPKSTSWRTVSQLLAQYPAYSPTPTSGYDQAGSLCHTGSTAAIGQPTSMTCGRGYRTGITASRTRRAPNWDRDRRRPPPQPTVQKAHRADLGLDEDDGRAAKARTRPPGVRSTVARIVMAYRPSLLRRYRRPVGDGAGHWAGSSSGACRPVANPSKAECTVCV